MSRVHQLKIGVSGIRGVVGEFLTPNLACAFAQAFGTYVGQGRVVLGRDTRSSGEMLEHAVTCGLLAAGCEVVKVGVAPTPTIQVYVEETRARGGIAITASHNPPEYNALKLFNREGLFFNQYERTELLDLYHQSEFHRATNDEIRRVVLDYDSAPERHLARVLKHVDLERIRQRRFRVALDGVNGAGSCMSVHFLRDVLGCELHAISVDPTQPFPREAEPRPEVLDDLRALMKECGADIAFAQDPDGDRLAVADETGRVLDNDDVLALAVDSQGETAELPTAQALEEHLALVAKLLPEQDRLALVAGLQDGTIDAIATDHAPHGSLDKNVEFNLAAFGVLGLETSLALVLDQLVRPGFLTASQAVDKLSCSPARIFSLAGKGSLAPGSEADLCLVDPEESGVVDPEKFQSKSRNTPFAGATFKGRVKRTMAGGKWVFPES